MIVRPTAVLAGAGGALMGQYRVDNHPDRVVLRLDGEQQVVWGAPGETATKAAAAYFACVNASGGIHGRPVQYLVENDQWNPELAAQAASKLVQGEADPSDPEFNLLPTLRDLILHHWEANTIFRDALLPNGAQAFRDLHAHLDELNDSGASGHATVVVKNQRIKHASVAEIENVWAYFRVNHVFRTDTSAMLRAGARWLGSLVTGGAIGPPKSLLDNSPLRELLSRVTDFDAVRVNVARGDLRAVVPVHVREHRRVHAERDSEDRGSDSLAARAGDHRRAVLPQPRPGDQGRLRPLDQSL